MLRFKLSTILVTVFCLFNAQVGINTNDPKITLDVVGSPADTSKLDGVIAPRITGEQLRAKSYTTSQDGAIVYVQTADTAPAGQTINVTAIGYYYFDKTLGSQGQWVKMGNGSAASAGITLTTTGTSGLATLTGTTLNIPNYTYTLPIASASTLGGVKIGSGINVAADGTISAAGTGGTVTSFSAGNLTPLFTTNVTNETSTPALAFTFANAPANSFFGNRGSAAAAPAYYTATSITADSSASGATSPLTITGGSNALVNSTGTTLAVNNTAPLWNANQLQGRNISNASAPTVGQVLTFDGTNWVASAPSTSTAFNVTSEITSSYTVLASDDFIKLNINVPGTALTLPTSGISAGKKIYISNIGLNSMDLSPLPRNSSYNVIQAGESATFVYLGGTGTGSWDRVSGY